MNTDWNQEVAPPQPVRTWTVLVIALLLPIAAMTWTVYRQWTPLQRHYLLTYIFTARGGYGHYRVVVANYPRNRQLLAKDDDVFLAMIPQGTPRQAAIPFALSDAARKRGVQSLAWLYNEFDNTKLHTLLANVIYDRQSLWDLCRSPAYCGVVFLFLLPWALAQDRKALRQLQKGRIRQGPRHVSRAEFNRLKKADGIGFTSTEPLTFRERLFDRAGTGMVRIPRREERSHLLLLGDSGSGKSSLIRQLLSQIRARGESAIVYDPALEFTPQFYDPARGDLILNPVDERMPYWTPSDEIQYAGEALTVANSLFPDRPHENPFFTEAARSIFAYLVEQYKPTPAQLTSWMGRFEEIDRRLEDTALAPFVSPTAGGQRAAVQSTFNQIAAALRLLPSERQGRERWSAAAWSRQRGGCLFLPSRHEIRDSLRPLQSLWLDCLLLRLMASVEGGASPIWVILDELASLQRLPQLPIAVTEARKANVRLVLGLQGRSQLEALYGIGAETILSQPMTKIFLRTSEPRAAKWISEAIGNVKIERLKESRTEPASGYSDAWKRRTKTYHLEHRTEALIMDSEIQGLPDMRGYLKSRNLVVSLNFRWIPSEKKHAGFIRRAPEGDELVSTSNAPATRPNRPRPNTGNRQEREESLQHRIFD